ncbi:hypothetical protein ACEPAH_9240 [Sanghuangporus vaninii]
MSSRSATNATILNERDELLEILSSMGVKLPASTNLHVDALQERLTKALDRSQRHAELFQHRRPNVGSFEPWIMGSGKTLKEAMISYNLQERAGGGDIGSFNELRIMLSESIGMAYELGMASVFTSEDSRKDRLIKLKVTGVYKMDDDTPFIAAEYNLGRTRDDDKEGIKMLNSPGGHAMFQKLLEVNATHSSEDRSRTGITGMTPSYLLPLHPLNHRDIGSLCKDVGCIICGNPSAAHCSRCRSIPYCGAAYQRSDWQRHKTSCLALDTGTWIRTKYSTTNLQVMLNRTSQGMENIPQENEPTGYGDDSFIIKLQLSSVDGNSMLVYDRKRSFVGQVVRSNDHENFERLQRVVSTGHLGLKIYLWSKYVGDHTLVSKKKQSLSMLANDSRYF